MPCLDPSLPTDTPSALRPAPWRGHGVARLAEQAKAGEITPEDAAADIAEIRKNLKTAMA